MNKKKLLALLMALVMTLTLVPVTAFAEGNVAKIGDTPYAKLKDAVAHAADGDTITLIGDVNETQVTVNTNSLTIDLNGNDIFTDYMIVGGKTLTIDDTLGGGSINSSDNDGMFVAFSGSTIVLKNGILNYTPSNTNGLVFSGWGAIAVHIEGGSIETNACITGGSDTTFYITGGKINGIGFGGWAESMGYNPSYSITGGSFYQSMNIDPANNKIGGVTVSSDYKIVADPDLSEGWYKVVSAAVAQIGDTPYATLAEAFAAANQASEAVTIQVLQNCTLDQVVTIAAGKTVTLDLDGKTVTVTNENIVENGIVVTSTSDGSKKTNAYDVEYTTTNACGKTVIQNNGTFTITGAGTIDATGLIDASATYFSKGTNNNGNTLYMINNSGKLTIENGTFNMFKELKTVVVRNANEATLAGGSYSSWSTVLNDGGGKMDITGGTYTGWAYSGNPGNPGGWRYAVAQYGLESEMTISDGVSVSGIHGGLGVSEGKLTVNGGTFESRTETGATAYRAGYFAGEKGNVQIIINGGTFRSAGNNEAILVGNKNTSGDGGEAIPISGIINGGTFIRKKNSSNVNDNAIKVSANSELIINGGYFDGTVNSDGVPSNVVVSGGEFSVDPSQLNSKNGATIADGYEVVGNNDATYLYKVQAKPVAQIGNVKYETLEAAVDAAQDNDTINLIADDIAVTSTIEITKSITINGNGNTINATGTGSGYALYVDEDTAKKKLDVVIRDLNMTTTGYQVAVMLNGSDLNSTLALNHVDITCDGECIYANGHTYASANNCNFTHKGIYATGKDFVYYSALIVGYGGSLEVSNCTVTSFGNGAATFPSGGFITLTNTDISINNETASETNAGYAIWSRNEDYTNLPEYNCDSVITFHSGKVSGDFKITDLYTTGDQNKYDPKIVIDGGIFSTKPAAAYIATGYQAIANTDTATNATYPWTVGKVEVTQQTDATVTVTVNKQVDVTGDQVPADVKSNETLKTDIQTNTSVSGVALTNNLVGETNGVQAVVEAAKAKVGSDLTNEVLQGATTVDVKVDVTVVPTEYTENRTFTFSLTPTATVTTKDENGATTATVSGVAVDNTMIDQTQDIEVTLYTGFRPALLTHRDDQNNVIGSYTEGDTASDSTFTYDTEKGTCKLIIHHFSTIEATASDSVASVDFEGGSLRRRVLTLDHNTVVRSETDFRMKFVFNLPDGATVNTANSYFYWSTSNGNPTASDRSIQITSIKKEKTTIVDNVGSTEYNYWAAMIINGVPFSAFDQHINCKMHLEYELNSKTYAVEITKSKTVNEIANGLTSLTESAVNNPWIAYGHYLLGDPGYDSYFLNSWA